MAQARVFLPQDAVEQWLAGGAAQVAGDLLTLDAQTFALSAAVRVLREVAGGDDVHGLVGTVKTLEQVGDLGGEVCAGSVVLGDCAFEVVEGFLGRFMPIAATPPMSHDSLVKLLGRR